MNFNLVLILIAAAMPVVLFADKMTQWGLRTILSEEAEYNRIKASVQEAKVDKEEEPAAAPASAQAA